MNINDAILRKLANRSRTIFEIRQHLQKKDFSEEEISAAIDEFIQAGYLNDYNYCQEYFGYGFGKGKGKLKVFSELRNKGVDPNIIQKAFDEYDEEIDETAMAYNMAKKILAFEEIKPGEQIPEKIKGRIGRRLASNGFTSDNIYKTLEKIYDEERQINE